MVVRRMIYAEFDQIDKVMLNKKYVKSLSYDRARSNRSESNKVEPYVYQYRTLESFWSIIQSDSFWATNARFSNDLEEQSLGIKKLKEILGTDEESVQSWSDCYIVCFCDEDDKLSQWRGYAPDGVSIGFDFNNIRPFYIKKRDKDEYVCVYNSCYKVQYIDENVGKDEFSNKFDLNLSKNDDNYENIRRLAADIIPYVKHKGFCEETESRLVFSNHNVDLSECIQYRNIGNIKIPYIIVKSGGEEKQKQRKCFIRLDFAKEQGNELGQELIKSGVFSKMKNVEIVDCANASKGGTDDKKCFGCTLREVYIPGVNVNKTVCRYSGSDKQFHIGERGEIYISDSQNQEKVCNQLQLFLQERECWKNVKIWCEGHLPIRSITVGNMRNREVVYESIKHYCNQHYWLRSVDVRKSNIPFRSTLI